jgi:hypothetical protein
MVQYGNIQKLYKLYKDLTSFLKTNGTSWKKPRSNFADNMPVNELVIDLSVTRSEDSCAKLFTFRETFKKSQDHYQSIQRVPLLIFYDLHEPHAVRMPFKEPGMEFNKICKFVPTVLLHEFKLLEFLTKSNYDLQM